MYKIKLRKVKRRRIPTKQNSDLEDFESRPEGKQKQIYTTVYERNPQLKIDAIKIHETTCKACEFNFEEKYGEYAKDFIHIHHIKPLFENEEYTEILINPKTDLVPVCPSCHAVIHRKKNKTLTIDELKKLINKKA
ncbi:MAG: HNH endonuclease [Halarcobacter sp.]